MSLVFEDLHMAMHLGKKIQEVAEGQGFSQSKLAKEINTTQQNISDLYTRPEIDTGLLKILSKKLNHDFGKYLYEEEPMLSFKQKETEEWQLKIYELTQTLAAKEHLLNEREKMIATQEKLIQELEKKLQKKC